VLQLQIAMKSAKHHQTYSSEVGYGNQSCNTKFQYCIDYWSELAMHHGFHLLAVRQWVVCHWPTNVSTMRLYVPLMDDHATWAGLCNASAHRSSLLSMHRQHTMFITPSV